LAAVRAEGASVAFLAGAAAFFAVLLVAAAFVAAVFVAAVLAGTAFTGRAAFLAGSGTGAVVVRRAVLAAGTAAAAGTAGDVRGVVTGDTDDLPGRWRELSGSARLPHKGNAEMI
jgi:hypothetical protein